jgi:hypothetical protein
MLKLHYCSKAYHSVVQPTWNLTDQYEYYCSFNNSSFIQLKWLEIKTLSEANKQSLYKNVSYMTKYSYCPFSSEYQLYFLS